jgi:hypothetical protein
MKIIEFEEALFPRYSPIILESIGEKYIPENLSLGSCPCGKGSFEWTAHPLAVGLDDRDLFVQELHGYFCTNDTCSLYALPPAVEFLLEEKIEEGRGTRNL